MTVDPYCSTRDWHSLERSPNRLHTCSTAMIMVCWRRKNEGNANVIFWQETDNSKAASHKNMHGYNNTQFSVGLFVWTSSQKRYAALAQTWWLDSAWSNLDFLSILWGICYYRGSLHKVVFFFLFFSFFFFWCTRSHVALTQWMDGASAN